MGFSWAFEASKQAANYLQQQSKPKVSSSSAYRASSSSSKSTSSSSKSTASTAKATPKINRDELAEQYQLTSGFINAYPEIKSLFDQAVKEGWTPDKFQAKLRNTTWYKSRSDTNRKMAVLMYTDPATYKRTYDLNVQHANKLIAELGIGEGMIRQRDSLAFAITYEGWSDEQAADYLGQFIVFGSNGQASGKAGEVQNSLNNYAYSMGVKNSDSWIQDGVRQVVRGKKSEQDLKNEILNQSIAAFPQYEKQLRAGSSMADLAQPYMQSMSQILELNPGSVNLFDPTIRKAMSYKDKSGVAGAQPLWEFQNSLRQDDRWKKTQNAQDAAMSTAHKVAQDLGIYF